jgi:rubredoxin
MNSKLMDHKNPSHDVQGRCEMTWFKCSKCGYTLETDIPPERCPSCSEKCVFIDATCYTPDCGGPGKIDPRIKGS